MSGRADRFRRLDETQTRGQTTEAILKAEFLLRDVPVLTPEYDNEPYDLVLDIGGEFQRVQAKTAYRGKEGTVQFETVSTRSRSSGYVRDGYEGDADYFGVYSPATDDCYLVEVETAASGKMELRHQPAKNNQTAGINWHEEYLLDDVLSDI
jgi:hypothetical protein